MKVFLKDEIHQEARALLESRAEIIEDWERIGEVDAIVVRKIKIPDYVFEEAGNLKVIGFHGSGMNGINLEEAKKHQVDVFAVPGLNAQSVAELNVTLALDLAHMVSWSSHEIKQGKDMKDGLHRFRGHEISNKTAGIIGMGAIGTMTATLLMDGFHMKVYGYSRSFTSEKAKALQVMYADSIDEILKISDFVFIALPLTNETKNLITYEKIEQMKPSAYLINAARGGIVNEEDLCRALENRLIAGAASDVFATEPVNPEIPLVRFDNFIATPHIAGNSEEALYRVGMGVVEGILKRLKEQGIQ
ncbi:MAG: NAD(P)-dependent oxidoreductase [Lachnospiraceae bacterium]|nr:NAD(P)-dependent oxidoreductase [Lachnospiraceae bacterium]